MNNKVLIKVYTPEYNKSYDIFIPVNELVWKVAKLMMKCISDINNINSDLKKEYLLINQKTNEIYNNNVIIRETDIRNGTELVLIAKM